MSNKGHNGWSNYETWNVALWVDNDQGAYEHRCEMARRARSPHALASNVKEWVEDMAPDLGTTMFADLLNAALSEVDWYEIAENWYAEAHEDDAEDEEEGGKA